jgi:hypothetical protein
MSSTKLTIVAVGDMYAGAEASDEHLCSISLPGRNLGLALGDFALAMPKPLAVQMAQMARRSITLKLHHSHGTKSDLCLARGLGHFAQASPRYSGSTEYSWRTHRKSFNVMSIAPDCCANAHPNQARAT